MGATTLGYDGTHSWQLVELGTFAPVNNRGNHFWQKKGSADHCLVDKAIYCRFFVTGESATTLQIFGCKTIPNIYYLEYYYLHVYKYIHNYTYI